MTAVVDAPARDASAPPRLGLLPPPLAARLSALVRAYPAAQCTTADAARCWRADAGATLADLERLAAAGWLERDAAGYWMATDAGLILDALPDLIDAAPVLLDLLPAEYECARFALSHLINRSNNR